MSFSCTSIERVFELIMVFVKHVKRANGVFSKSQSIDFYVLSDLLTGPHPNSSVHVRILRRDLMVFNVQLHIYKRKREKKNVGKNYFNHN